MKNDCKAVKYRTCKLAMSLSEGKKEEDIILSVSRSGRYDVSWSNLKQILKKKLVEVVNTCGKRYLDLKGKETVEGHVDFLTKNLSNFSEAPFTLQRLCEILVNAEAHYKSTHKLVYALTKLLSVTSTYPRGSGQYTDNREMETADPAPMDVDDT
eukprot:g2258.t1